MSHHITSCITENSWTSHSSLGVRHYSVCREVDGTLALVPLTDQKRLVRDNELPGLHIREVKPNIFSENASAVVG